MVPTSGSLKCGVVMVHKVNFSNALVLGRPVEEGIHGCRAPTVVTYIGGLSPLVNIMFIRRHRERGSSAAICLWIINLQFSHAMF